MKILTERYSWIRLKEKHIEDFFIFQRPIKSNSILIAILVNTYLNGYNVINNVINLRKFSCVKILTERLDQIKRGAHGRFFYFSEAY